MASKGDEQADDCAKEVIAAVRPPPRQRKRANQSAGPPPYSAIARSPWLLRPIFSACAPVQLRFAEADRRGRKSGANAGLGCAPPDRNRRSTASSAPHAQPRARDTASPGSDTRR